LELINNIRYTTGKEEDEYGDAFDGFEIVTNHRVMQAKISNQHLCCETFGAAMLSFPGARGLVHCGDGEVPLTARDRLPLQPTSELTFLPSVKRKWEDYVRDYDQVVDIGLQTTDGRFVFRFRNSNGNYPHVLLLDQGDGSKVDKQTF